MKGFNTKKVMEAVLSTKKTAKVQACRYKRKGVKCSYDSDVGVQVKMNFLLHLSYN